MQQPNEWLLALEQERLDTTWREPRTLYAPLPESDSVELRRLRKENKRLEARLLVEKGKTLERIDREQRKRDKAFYDAGRFSMGAEDIEALDGQQTVIKLTRGK